MSSKMPESNALRSRILKVYTKVFMPVPWQALA
jgi:hypothetical protein